MLKLHTAVFEFATGVNATVTKLLSETVTENQNKKTVKIQKGHSFESVNEY